MIGTIPRLLVDRLLKAWMGRRRNTFALGSEQVRELIRGLEEEKEALQSFTVAMETEFLELGSLLRAIMSVAREVRESSDAVIAATAGRTEDAAIQFAFQLLKKAEDLVLASREQYNNVFAVFDKLHSDLTDIARERSALMRTLSPLETTNVQFRIQACSFDADTRGKFFDLSEAIGAIVLQVQTAVGQRFEELERTGEATGKLAANLTALAAEQRRETERRLTDTRDHLSALNSALLSSEASAQSLSESGLRIAGGVTKTIVALQCQDMARQKFQHISAAIDEIIVHLAAGCEEGFVGAAETDCLHFLSDAASLQLGQLRAVFEQLEESARQIGSGLVEVESESKALADHAVRSGGATLDGQIIGRAIESIHAVLGVIENAVVSIRSVVELVQKLKSTFTDCTSQILELAQTLRVVALNAQIFAAHVDSGTSLEVVAKNTRTIADEAMEQLDNISSRVTDLVNSVVNLEQRLADYRELAMLEQNRLSSEASESEAKLRTLEQGLRLTLAAIGPLERRLSETVRHATLSIRFPEAVSEASARSTTFFEHTASGYSKSWSETDGPAHHKVQDLQRNYTMAHERVVHELAIGSLIPAATVSVDELQPAALTAEQENESTLLETCVEAAAGHGMESSHEELADNIELF